METSLPLATDSFSYSWLSGEPPLDGLEEPLRESMYSSYGGTSKEYQNFNFDICITRSPALLVHADELFSDGLVRPVFVDPSKVESCNSQDPNQTKLSLTCPSRIDSPRTVEIHHGFLTSWRKSTRRILRNLFRYVNQFCQKVERPRKSTRVDDIDKTEWQVKSWSSSQQASPKPNTAHPIGDLHDHENSVYEAVLHCKRSIEN